MGCTTSQPQPEVPLSGLLAAVRVGDRLEVADRRALHLRREANATRCGAGWDSAAWADQNSLWYAPASPGYWWPANVLEMRPTRGVKIHWAGYSSDWDEWISNGSHSVRLATVSDDLGFVPLQGTRVEVQLIQNATFWAPGIVTGRAADGRVEVELSVNRNNQHYHPYDFHTVRVPLRLLRLTGAATATATERAGALSAVAVSGAGVDFVNGIYVRDGTYGGVPLFKNGQTWLLRYRLQSGAHFWYLADKDRLDVDDGDYYRIRSEARLPPVGANDMWTLAKSGVSPTPSFELLYDQASPAIAVPVPVAVTTASEEPPLARDGSGAPMMGVVGVAMNVHDLPVVMGEVIVPDVGDGSSDGSLALNTASTSRVEPVPPGLARQLTGAAAPPPALMTVSAILRHELGITSEAAPTLKELVEAAAGMLGIETHDKALVVVATECWRVLGSPPSLNSNEPSV
eukprot:CAMPEP_0119362928 /NCGR_PEP_ID=MMETSP1334-20130426/9810_1 /TAXON_ID=127549 /ORGANISM="Calcidiscus leptoporus, Strain RCC1130" /LENGTH=457 /DNA_ID=CAMNT_0007378199 /DNA_START=57 /DNA_END=1430 /DNA_ORIENTATION=-